MMEQRLPPPAAPLEPSTWSADRILLLRRFIGWTQQDLANHLEVGRQTVSEWERGAAHPLPLFERRLDALKEQAQWSEENP